MIRRSVFLFAILALSAAHAKDPCHTKSKQMTLIKNCYTGDMVKPLDGGARFFGAMTGVDASGASYCYNSLIMVEHKTGDPQMHIRVLKDSREGQMRVFDYPVTPEDIKKINKDTPLLSLKGLKGSCFSGTGDKEACNGGLLKVFGLKDMDSPLIVALGRAGGGQLTVSHLAQDPKELASHKPKELDGTVTTDTSRITARLVDEIRRKLSAAAHAKMSSLHAGTTNPRKMSETSEQFRYCSLAFESYLKFQRLPDPFSSEEKMTLATLTNYMNGDAMPGTTTARAPASNSRSRKTK